MFQATTDRITITPVGSDLEIDKYKRQLETLLVVPKGSIPGWRAYGVAGDGIDLHEPGAVNVLGIEIERAVEEFIPEIRIVEVAAVMHEDGTVDLDLHVELR